VTARDVLAGWMSQAIPVRHAAELLPAESAGGSLEAALTRIAMQLGAAQFLIVKVRDISPPALNRAVEAFLAAGGTARISFAGHRPALTTLAISGIDDDHVGLMLDDVDIDTAYSDLIWDRLEAVRFSGPFVARAARDVRTGCALESMLGLAREIGLQTLGPGTDPKSAGLPGRSAFDYLPAAFASAMQRPDQRSLSGHSLPARATTLSR